MAQHMLTTVDNPYNPFTQWDDWYAFDVRHDYNTLALLARVVVMSDELSESDQSYAIEQGMNEIVKENVSGMHRMVTQSQEAA